MAATVFHAAFGTDVDVDGWKAGLSPSDKNERNDGYTDHDEQQDIFHASSLPAVPRLRDITKSMK
jgi:hypothetical protein